MTARRLRRAALALLAAAAGILVLAFPLPRIAREHLRALAFLDVPRPRPTGGFPVGVTTLERPDGTSVDLWYPADAGRVGLNGRVGALLQRLLWPTQAIGLRDAQPAAGPPRPLVVLVPSWFSQRRESSFTSANLASHGFVVAAVDDIVHAAPLQGDDRVAQRAGLDYASEDAFAASLAVARRRVALGARATSAAIDAVLAHPRLGSGIDGGRVAVLGFSFGGSVAAAMARSSARIRAAINLDGDVIDVEQWPPSAPYLFLASDLPYPTSTDLTAHDLAFRFESITTRDTYDLHLRSDMPQDSLAFRVREATHLDFCDRLLAPPLRDFWHRRDIDRAAMWSDINRLVVSFLDGRLRSRGDGAAIETAAPSARFVGLPAPESPAPASPAPASPALAAR